jgi:PAS domain S-box-containing protein
VDKTMKTQSHVTKNDILIVDDTQENLVTLRRILMEQGYKVRPAINGPLALQMAKKAVPDLILLDIRMPEMDGYEVCRRLKADEATHEIPVLFLSALDDTEAKVKAFEIGGVDYITKPFQVEEVIARVETHLTLRAMQKQLQDHAAKLARTNAALIREKYITDTFMATVPDRIYFKDRNGHITRANHAHASQFGLHDPAEEVGKTDFDFIPEEIAQIKYDQEQEIIRTGQPLIGLEEPDAQGGWTLTTKMPLRDEKGELIGTFGISRDITDLKQAQRVLEQAYAEILALNDQLKGENLRYYLKSLLVGTPFGPSMVGHQAEFQNAWNRTCFCVVLVKLLSCRSPNATSTSSEQDVFRPITQLFQEYLELTSLSGIISPLTLTEAALILNTDDSLQIHNLCEFIVSRSQALLAEHGYTLILGIGKETRTPEKLHDSYDTAQHALRARRNTLATQIIVYKDTEQSEKEALVFFFPFEREHTLIASVIGGHTAKVTEIINDIVEENRLEQSNYQKLVALYDRFLRTAGKILAKAPIQGANAIEALLLATFRKARPETIAELQERLFDLFQQLASIYAQHNKKRPDILKEQLIQYLENHYSDPNLSLDSLAEVFNLHPNYLSTYFKDRTGMNYVDYLAMQRINRAKELLITQPEQKIQEISAQVGFFNPETFIRVFKRFEGMTPGAYKKLKNRQSP